MQIVLNLLPYMGRIYNPENLVIDLTIVFKWPSSS